MPYKISIDKEACIGCGLCSSIAPNIFDLKDGKAIAKKAKIDDKDFKKTKEASDSCPVTAIKISKA